MTICWSPKIGIGLPRPPPPFKYWPEFQIHWPHSYLFFKHKNAAQKWVWDCERIVAWIAHAPQGRQSARLILQSSDLGPPPPTPLPAGECVPSPPPLGFRGEGHTRLRERVGLGVPIRTRGQTLWYSRYVCTLWNTQRFMPFLFLLF
jgi:hypothetical protein